MANGDSDNNSTNMNVAKSPTAVFENVAVSIKTLPPPERFLAILALIFLGVVIALAYVGALTQISPLYVLGFTFLIILGLGFLYFLSQGGVRSEVQLTQAKVHGNWDKVIKIYKARLAKNDNDTNTKNMLSDAYIEHAKAGTYINTKNIREAISDDYVSALTYNPFNFNARIRIAKAYHLLGELDQAIRAYNYAIQLKDQATTTIPQENYINELGNRGWVYYDLQHYSQAIDDFDKVLQYYPDNAWVYMKRGHAYRAIGKFAEAKKNHIKSVQYSPKSGAYYGNVGKMCLILKDATEANTWYQRGYEKDKTIINNGWMALWSQLCLAPPKDYHDIAEKLRKIAGEVPDSHMATPCLGVSYWLDQDEKRAQNTFQKFIDDYPGLWDAYFWMSIVNVNQDRSDDAISDLEAALSRKMPPILLSPLRWFTPLPFQQRVRSRYKELFNYKSGHAFFSFFVPHGGQHKSSA